MTTEIDFTSLAILGTLTTLLVQWLKNKFGTSELGTLTIVALLSLVLGGVVYFISGTSFMETFWGILVIAGAIYTYIIERFEK